MLSALLVITGQVRGIYETMSQDFLKQWYPHLMDEKATEDLPEARHCALPLFCVWCGVCVWGAGGWLSIKLTYLVRKRVTTNLCTVRSSNIATMLRRLATHVLLYARACAGAVPSLGRRAESSRHLARQLLRAGRRGCGAGGVEGHRLLPPVLRRVVRGGGRHEPPYLIPTTTTLVHPPLCTHCWTAAFEVWVSMR